MLLLKGFAFAAFSGQALCTSTKKNMVTRILKSFIAMIYAVTLISCGNNGNKILTGQKAHQSHKDTIILEASNNEADSIVNDYLTDQLTPIRQNFKRINSITHWTKIIKKDFNESTEGGEANFYYSNGGLEKIVTRNFGETSQQLSEFYLLNGQLSFVFEKKCNYNRPIYYDSVAMKENEDTEVFDLKKSEFIEDRSYFEKGKLIHQLNNQDCGSPFSDDYLSKEQMRITTDFGKLLKHDVK